MVPLTCEMCSEASFDTVATLVGHSERVWDIAWIPSGNVLASASADKTVRLWKAEVDDQWRLFQVIDGVHTRTIRRCSFSPCAQYLALASFDGLTSVWSLAEDKSEYQLLTTLEGHESEVKDALFSPSSQYLATCSRDKSVWIWECGGMDESTWECAAVLTNHLGDVKKLCWHPSLDVLVSAGYDDSIRIWMDDGEEWTSLEIIQNAHTSTIWDLCWMPIDAEEMEKDAALTDPDASSISSSLTMMLASSSQDGTVTLWKAARTHPVSGAPCGFTRLVTIAGYHSMPVYGITFVSSTILITACGDDAIRCFYLPPDLATNADSTVALLSVKDTAHESDVNAIRSCPKDKALLASCGDDDLIKIWRLRCW